MAEDKIKNGFLIATIAEQTGLPKHQEASDLHQPLGMTLGATLYHKSSSPWLDIESMTTEWIPIPSCIVKDVSLLSVARLLGQGVLIETQTSEIAFVSIAEASYVQLGDLHGLLECVLIALEHSLSLGKDATAPEWTLAWKEEISEDMHALRELSLRGRSLRGRSVISERSSTSSLSADFEKATESLRQEYQKILHANTILRQKLEEELPSHVLAQFYTDNPILQETQLARALPRYYTSCSCPLAVRLKDSVWHVVMIKSGYKCIDAAKVLQWLEMILQGYSRDYNQSSTKEQLVFVDPADLRNEPSKPGCWRRKIIEAKIFKNPISKAMAKPGHGAKRFWVPLHDLSPHPFNLITQDGLILTAAALWSLFDGSLQRLSNCTCSLKSAGGNIIQSKMQRDDWLLWHMLAPNEKACDGTQCFDNQSISFAEGEAGKRLYTNTPCVLGWTVDIRTTADMRIATKYPLSPKFEKEKMIWYKIESLQGQVQLSVPAPVTPQIAGAVTFSKRMFKVSNSIDEESIFVILRAISMPILVYCEKRGLHLLMEGADVVEEIARQLLREMECVGIPEFTGTRVRERIDRWNNTMFMTRSNISIPGSVLLRQSAQMVSRLMDCTRSASNETRGKPIYWSLANVFSGGDIFALKNPPSPDHISWHQLASKYPLIILAVGEINTGLLWEGIPNITWINHRTTNRLNKIRLLLHSVSAHGAIMGSPRLLARWLCFAQDIWYGNLEVTENEVSCGTGFEKTLEFRKVNSATMDYSSADYRLPICTLECGQDDRKQCLHYIQ